MRKVFGIAAFVFVLHLIPCTSVSAQGNQVDFSSIPTTGAILVYAHHDDDMIWMLPFWPITDKFISGAMPTTPSFDAVYQDQQTYLNNNNYNIPYLSNWYTPWGSITDDEYTQYYWGENPAYNYLQVDHLETRTADNHTPMSDYEINKIKAKLEEFISSPEVDRIITHNNYGEYNNEHHRAVNKAVRQLAVKYRKDVWMLGCTSRYFVDWPVTGDITYTYGNYNSPALFDAIRNIYKNHGRWTWYDDTPSGNYRYIKIVDGGNDKSAILNGDEITYPGEYQDEPGAYIFDGADDYLTLNGNNNSSFTIAMWVRPDQIRAMEICKMAEHPFSDNFDRNIYLNADGRVSTRIYDGSSRVVTSTTALLAGTWVHIAITSGGGNLKIYINGVPENSVAAGTAITNYSSPEFVLGQPGVTNTYFDGQMRDVAHYNRVLSDAEIADLSGVVGIRINASAGPGGTISPSGTITFNGGETQTYTISANTGHMIEDVKVDHVSVGAVSTYTFTNISANHTISATFTPFTYSIESSAGTGGTISPSGTITVSYGTNRTFTMTPGYGYQIADVKVDNVSVGSVSTYTFSNITGNHTIAATFSLETYTIAASAGSGGSITPSGAITVNHGSSRTFTINPDNGYQILDVKVDNYSVGVPSEYTFSNITSDHSITATFKLITYTIESSAGTGGTISPSGTITLNQGESRTFNIAANTGYVISDVIVDNVSVGTPSSYTFNNVTANHTIAATFAPITFTITSTAGAGGSISPAGTVTVNYGNNRTFTITPNSGYRIVDVMIDNISAGAITTYTFSNVTAVHTITASFEVIPTYTIISSAGSGGNIDPAGAITVNEGSNKTFSISANTGFKISDVKVDNMSVGSPSSYTFSNIVANHSITATFEILTFTITSSAGSGGTISPLGTTTVNYGTNRTYTITPNAGYEITDVKVDNVSVGKPSSYTFNNITAIHTISATFALITYTITSSAGTGGTINPSGTVTLTPGANQTYTIVASTGYKIADVKVDDISVGIVNTYTFSNLNDDHTISAEFALLTYSITAGSSAGGTISPAGTTTVNHGSNVTYSITANEGYQVSDVKADNVSVGSVTTYTFTNVTTNHTISATFARKVYTITSYAGSGGSISPSGSVTLEHGSNKTYTIIANSGYQIADVMIDNVSVGSISSYTFQNITANHTITATFTPILYTITSNAGSGGTISPSGAVAVEHGSSRTFIINANEGYKIADVVVDGLSVGTNSHYTFSNITANHSITATFIPIPVTVTYTITSGAGAGGTIVPSGVITVTEGTDRTYAIMPDAGNLIADVVVDGVSVGSVAIYTFENISANHSISASFAPIPPEYTITSSHGPGGTIDPAGSTSVPYGTSITYAINPASGYQIDNVLVDGESMGPVSSYTFVEVTANHTISASFLLVNTYKIAASSSMAGGVISPSGVISVTESSNVTYYIYNKAGFRIDNVLVDGLPVGPVQTYTFDNIQDDHRIAALFSVTVTAKVFPNPFKDEFILDIASPDECTFDIYILDMKGKSVYSLHNIFGNNRITVDMTGVPSGNYVLNLYIDEEQVTVYRLIKVK